MDAHAHNRVRSSPWPAAEMGSWEEFVEWVNGTPGRVFLYRGQPEAYGTLEPKYLRLLRGPAGRSKSTDRGRADRVEKDLLDGFVREAPLHLDEMPVRRLVLGSPEENILQWWGIMQHHGAPTRVLDWTGSPYVAAYFAVEKELDSTGEVLGYDQETLEDVWRAAFQDGRLKGYPRRLAEYTGDGLRIDDRPVLHHFILQMQTGRMAAQQAVFTVCTDVYGDHAQLIQQVLGADGAGLAYRRAVIPAKLKIEFLEQLRFMNITGVSLFPGIDGVGRRTAEAAHIHLLRPD